MLAGEQKDSIMGMRNVSLDVTVPPASSLTTNATNRKKKVPNGYDVEDPKEEGSGQDTATNRSPRTVAAHRTRRKAIRTAVPESVEESQRSKVSENITVQHVVKIVLGDDEVAEISQEQLQRVRTSTYIGVKRRSYAYRW